MGGELLIFVLFLFLSFLIRLAFSLVKSPNETDGYAHVFWTRERKRQGLNFDANSSVLPGKAIYPPLNHTLLSLFPEKKWVIVAKSLNILWDCLLAVCIYFATNGLAALFSDFTQPSSGLSVGFFTALISITTPIFFPNDSRFVGFGARTLGGLLVFIHLCCFFYGYYYQVEFIILCLITSFLLHYGSLFGVQALFFTSLGLSVSLQTIYPLAIFLAPLTASIFPRGGMRDLIRWKIDHTRWYISVTEANLGFRNRLSDFISIPKFIVYRQWGKLYTLYARANSYVIVFFNVPLLCLFVMLLLRDFYGVWYLIDNTPILQFSFYIFLSFLCAFLLTSLKILSWIGPPERYFEYCSPWLSLLVVSIIYEYEWQSELFCVSVLLAHFILIIFHYIIIHRLDDVRRNLLSGMGDYVKNGLLEFLSNSEERSILCIPAKKGMYFDYVAKNSKLRFYHLYISTPSDGLMYMTQDLYRGMPKTDLQAMVDKWGIDTIILVKKSPKLNQITYDFSKWVIVYEDSDHVVYSLN